MLVVQSVIDSIREYRAKNNTDNKLNIGVLVSGGVDSIVLLHVLNKLKEQEKLNISVLHVMFDDFESASKATSLVKELSARYQLEYLYRHSDIANKTSQIKETARNELKAIAFTNEYDLVFTGHHQDDQIETILYRILRGTGTDGLKGMTTFSDYILDGKSRTFCKPFLSVSKKELTVYTIWENLVYVYDETNHETNSDRNYLRLKVLPVISKRFSVKNILLTTKHIAEETQTCKITTLDIYAGEWCVNDVINLPTLNRVFLIKEYLRVMHGYNISKRLHTRLAESFNSDLSNFRVYLGMSLELKKLGDKFVVDYVKQ